MSEHNVYVTIGASSHSKRNRNTHDFYATPPLATRQLLELEQFNSKIWEPAVGMWHIADVLTANGKQVVCNDIIDMLGRGIECKDFLTCNEVFDGDIITNPPYCIAQEFIEHALEVVKPGAKVAMFLRLSFLEGLGRYEGIFKDNPPIRIWVPSARLGCSPDGNFDDIGNYGSAVAFAWFVWIKGYHDYPEVRWFNTSNAKHKQINDFICKCKTDEVFHYAEPTGDFQPWESFIIQPDGTVIVYIWDTRKIVRTINISELPNGYVKTNDNYKDLIQ